MQVLHTQMQMPETQSHFLNKVPSGNGSLAYNSSTGAFTFAQQTYQAIAHSVVVMMT